MCQTKTQKKKNKIKYLFVKLKIDLGGENVKKLTTILNIDSKHPKILQFL